MSHIPAELKFLTTHEWVRVEADGTAFIGISDHAQSAMGDLVFVELPEVGTAISAGEELGVVESVKAASDIYAPISGEILAVNDNLSESPELINADPYGDGWICQIQLQDPNELDDLLSAEDYSDQLEEDDDA
jgi:glycine cleavage system H protein